MINHNFGKNTFFFFCFLLVSLLYFARAFVYNMLPSAIDVYGQFYPMMKIIKEQYLSGQFPFWNNFMFSGFPIMAGAQHAVLYPISMLILLLLPVHSAYLVDLTLHYALAGFFTFLYSRKIGNGTFPSFMAGILFAFLGYLMPHINHLSILRTAVWIPLIFYFFEDIRVTGRVRSSLVASAVMAVQVYAGHPQICFYTYLLLSFFVVFYLFHAVPGGKMRFVTLCILAMVLGLLIASPQIYATYQLSTLSVRPGFDYANFSSFSFPLNNIPFLVVPFQTGRNVEGYVGWLPAVLAAVAFIKGVRGNVHVRFWGSVAIISLCLSLGNALPLLNKFMYHVPVYNSFRGLSKHILEFSLSISLLFAFGISAVLSHDQSRRYLYLMSILLFPLLSFSIFELFSEGSGGLFPVVAITSASIFVVMILTVLILKSRRYYLFKYIVAASMVLEILTFKGVGWISVDKIDHHCASLFNLFSEKDYRVAFFADDITVPLAMRHRINLVDGYDPLILGDYNTLFKLDGIGVWPSSWPQMVKNNLMLSMMNVRFLVLPEQKDIGNREAYRKVFVSPPYAVYENLNCLPRAFSVSKVLDIEGADKIRRALMSSKLQPASQAAVSKKDLAEMGAENFTRGRVAVLSYAPTRVLLRTDFKGRGFVVLSDTYYPGWHAFIDGRLTKIYKADGILRGVVVPFGVHELKFVYRPVIIYALMGLSLITLAGILLTLALPALRHRK